jgi:hypothetical protein
MDTAKVQFHHYEQDWLDPVDHLGVFYERYLQNVTFINYPILEGKSTIKCIPKYLLNLMKQNSLREADSLLASQKIPYHFLEFKGSFL